MPSSGKAMTRMRMATNSRWRNDNGVPKEAVEFHQIVAFARLAETMLPICIKGRRIYVEGKLRTRQYEGNDGQLRISTEVVADYIRVLSPTADADPAAEESGTLEGIM